MIELTQEDIWNHLNLVSKEISKMKREYKRSPDEFGDLDHRLYWAIRGVDPHKAVCKKHNRKITKNDYGQFICGDCVDPKTYYVKIEIGNTHPMQITSPVVKVFSGDGPPIEFDRTPGYFMVESFMTDKEEKGWYDKTKEGPIKYEIVDPGEKPRDNTAM